MSQKELYGNFCLPGLPSGYRPKLWYTAWLWSVSPALPVLPIYFSALPLRGFLLAHVLCSFQRKLWVLFCVQNKQKAQHCLLCIIPLLSLWIYKYCRKPEWYRNSCVRRSLSTEDLFPCFVREFRHVRDIIYYLPCPGSKEVPKPMNHLPSFPSQNIFIPSISAWTQSAWALWQGVFPVQWCFAQWYVRKEHPPTGRNNDDHEGRWTVTALCPSGDGWKWEGIWFSELCFRALLICCMPLLHLCPSVYKQN